MKLYSYLALGDSYTIGEHVLLADSFPYQTVQLLRKEQEDKDSNLKHQFAAPEIIAKTGWTTDELKDGMDKTIFLPSYDLVSLLIGVNNQYRGKSAASFQQEFNHLLHLSLALGGGDSKNVFVISIPDWGLTPFGVGKDQATISKEIDAYNKICKEGADKNNCAYIDITGSQRQDVTNTAFLAADGLHPSGKEYAKWAAKLVAAIKVAQK